MLQIMLQKRRSCCNRFGCTSPTCSTEALEEYGLAALHQAHGLVEGGLIIALEEVPPFRGAAFRTFYSKAAVGFIGNDLRNWQAVDYYEPWVGIRGSKHVAAAVVFVAQHTCCQLGLLHS